MCKSYKQGHKTHSGFLLVLTVKASPAHSTVALIEQEDVDPWDLPELKDTGVPWSGENLSCTCNFVISPSVVTLVFHRSMFPG